jgi:hypothetical protein
MALTQDEIDLFTAQRAALWSVYVSGQLTVEFGDRRVTYQSSKDLKAAIDAIDATLNAASDEPRPRSYLGYSSKGF